MLAPVLFSVLALAAPAPQRSVSAVCKPVHSLSLDWEPGGRLTLTSIAPDQTETVLARVDGTGAAVVSTKLCGAAKAIASKHDFAWVPFIVRKNHSLFCVPSPYSQGKYVNMPAGTIRLVLTHLKNGGNRLELVNGRYSAALATVVGHKDTITYTPTFCVG